MKIKYISILLLIIQILCIISGCTSKDTDYNETETTQIEGDDQMEELNSAPQIQTGISWAPDQALPIFSPPGETLYSLHNASLSPDERIAFSALQGIVNKTQPRILITEDSDLPPTTWIKTFGMLDRVVNKLQSKYTLFEEFKDEIKGLVVYDTTKSAHYRNVASTIANINGYLPVTETLKQSLSRAGVEFDESNIIDITDWQEKSPADIYERLYGEYWNECSKRLVISANPNGDLDHCRDIAAAVGAAVIYLDCTKANEKALYGKFMQDMADSRYANNETAIVMGWFTTERSGVTAGSAYGISTIPADFYISGSVYSGITGNSDPYDRTINIPAVPAKNDVENKVYVAVYMTDGDNIQYVQRFMRKLWDSEEEKNNRGKVAVNWTISPSLVDIGPGLLNYYYNNSTEKECFVSGPSGIGYLMPINTNKEKGVELKDYLTNKTYMDAYTKLTGKYVERTGLRAVTVWDDANDDLRNSYEQNCRYLYGLTIHNFGAGDVSSGDVNDRLRFVKHETHYEGMYNTILESMTKNIRKWDRSEPLFLSYQIKTWANDDGSYTRTAQIIKLCEKLNERFDGMVEFVRADHFFALYNEANGMPFNLCMNGKTSVTSSDTSSNPDNIKDGTPSTIWRSGNSEIKWIQLDLNEIYNITRYVVRQAGETANKFSIQLSADGNEWTAIPATNTDNVTDVDLEKAVSARYVKIIFENAGSEFVVSVADVEIYGRTN